MTRGEGGQNAIGPELFEALGVLRTGELMAIHRYDGVEQYFGRAYEFGFSFSVEETFAKWGREETLGDVVRVVRAFRPDVILTLPLEGEGGGQHHQAVGRLAREAFRAAADPARFPEQLREGLRPWQARKIYQGGVGGYGEVPGAPVRVPTGVYDPLLGMTWQQLGARARAMHRCQGAGQLGADPGPGGGRLQPPRRGAAGGRGPRATSSTASTRRSPASRRFAPGDAASRRTSPRCRRRRRAARAAFDPASPETAVARARRGARARCARSRGSSTAASPIPCARAEIAERLREEEQDVEAALALAQGLVLEARADDGLVTPGQEVGVAVSLFNAGGTAARGGGPRARGARRLDGRAAGRRGRPAARRGRAPGALHRGPVAPDARPSQPYWRRERDRDRNELLVPADETRPWSPPALVARARCRVDGVVTTLRTPVAWRYEGPFVGGERRHEVQVVPALSVRVSPEITVGAARLAPRADRGAGLRAPHGPRGRRGRRPSRGAARAGRSPRRPSPLRFSYEGEEAGARFRVTPPAVLAAGALALRAVAVARRPRVPRGGPGRRVRPRRAPPAPAAGGDARPRPRRAHGARRVRSATSWARATRWPTPSGRWACR